MKSDDRFEELWNDYIEGHLNEAGMAELQDLLEADADRATSAADRYRTHRLLELWAREGSAKSERFVRETIARLDSEGSPKNTASEDQAYIPPDLHREQLLKSRRIARWSLAIATIAATLALYIALRPSDSESSRPVFKVVELSGAIQWIGDGGRVSTEIESGRALHGGTMESFSPDSWVVLEFNDGSTVTTSGPTLLTISEADHKQVHLRHGLLSANVRPQDLDHPMLVRTPNVELQVLGTQFNVDVSRNTTALTVNEGRVGITHRADGRNAEVSANQQLVVSEDSSGPLLPADLLAPVFKWRPELGPTATNGRWLSSQDLLARKLKAAVKAGKLTEEEAQAAYKNAANLGNDGGRLTAAPVVLGTHGRAHESTMSPARKLHLIKLSVSQGPKRPAVVLQPDARIRVEGRIRSSAEITLGLTTRHPGGGYSGKLKVTQTIDVSEKSRAFLIELPFTEFRSGESVAGGLPGNQELSDVWLTTDEDVGLELTSVELIPPAKGVSPGKDGDK